MSHSGLSSCPMFERDPCVHNIGGQPDGDPMTVRADSIGIRAFVLHE